jgi:hypothetical protein
MAMPARTPVHRPSRWTIEQLYALPDDGSRHEIIGGELFVTPAPSLVHQNARRSWWSSFGAVCSNILSAACSSRRRIGERPLTGRRAQPVSDAPCVGHHPDVAGINEGDLGSRHVGVANMRASIWAVAVPGISAPTSRIAVRRWPVSSTESPQACPNAMRAPAARLKIPISSEHPRILQIPNLVQDACPAAR